MYDRSGAAREAALGAQKDQFLTRYGLFKPKSSVIPYDKVNQAYDSDPWFQDLLERVAALKNKLRYVPLQTSVVERFGNRS
jgi:hypothetical protein